MSAYMLVANDLHHGSLRILSALGGGAIYLKAQEGLWMLRKQVGRSGSGWDQPILQLSL